YQPEERRWHSTVKVGDYLYMWGGYEYRIHYDVMEVYHLPTGAWDQKPTTGTPPPGTWGYSSVAIGKDIYYFGGREADDQNSLHSFDVDSFKWKEFSPSSCDHGPMKKGLCEMVSVNFDGEDYLIIIGGYGSSSINPPKQPDAQYSGDGRYDTHTAHGDDHTAHVEDSVSDVSEEEEPVVNGSHETDGSSTHGNNALPRYPTRHRTAPNRGPFIYY
ncbi:PREDICTED: kelch domain-containing protein 2-like, partial [Amphimedon queenslandica]|uniref:Uncharacterized protein n=1 Tax=Amphimedon queenslandica TaxID=400682 RepID=A0AAN0ISE4_AMPQE